MTTTRPGRIPPGAVRRLALVFFVLAGATLAAVAAPRVAHAEQGDIGPPHARVHWRTIPHAPCAGQPITFRFSLCECAWDLTAVESDSENGLSLHLIGDSAKVCATCRPDSFEIALPGPFAAGNYTFRARMLFGAPGADSAWTFDDRIDFSIGPPCHGGTLPFLDRIHLGEGRPCPECPWQVSPCDSVTLRLFGTFPDACRQLVGVSLQPNPALSPLPQPPIVRITYGNFGSCSRCLPTPTQWEATVRLPEQSFLGDLVQTLPIEAEEFDLCAHDSVPTFLGRISVPFVVAERCSTPPIDLCFNVAWSDSAPGRCNATFDKTDPARLVFRVGSTVAIAGIEGTLALDTEALAADGLVAARPDWVVQSSRHLDGTVRFVAFATSPGAAIPGTHDGRPQDVLVVRVHLSGLRVAAPDVARLEARNLLVSDGAGRSIRACPVITLVDPPPWVALLCKAGRCDANGDGRSDVRDLVVMVSCLGPQPHRDISCPDPSLGLDCTADGTFDLEDVFCCARVMLGGERPDSTGGDSLRVAPDVALRFGLPRDLGDGTIEVPLAFAGIAGTVAAARVDLAYPDARYEVVDVSFRGMPSSWWTLHEVAGGRVRLGLLDLAAVEGGPIAATPANGEAVLRLRLVPGASAGGELTVAGHDFAAGDGVRLTTPNADARLALGPLGRVALSAPRPNPFAAGTTLALTLPVAGAIDVGVFDVAGRRVATLLRQSAASAGVYTLSWNGTEAGGARASGGVYFVRVAGAAGDGSRKILFLPGAAR